MKATSVPAVFRAPQMKCPGLCVENEAWPGRTQSLAGRSGADRASPFGKNRCKKRRVFPKARLTAAKQTSTRGAGEAQNTSLQEPSASRSATDANPHACTFRGLPWPYRLAHS